MSLRDIDSSYNVRSYIRPAVLNGLRGLIFQANELHINHNNNTMSEAIIEFLDAAKASLEYQGGSIPAPAAAPAMQERTMSMSAPTQEEDPEEHEEEGEILFDSREEAIEALDLPETREQANKLKAKDIIKIAYGVGNDDPLSFLNMPAKEAAENLSKKDLLTLIYGEAK